MMTKACTNSKCPAYAHFVYTVATRCVLCRCDLMTPHRTADAAVAEPDAVNRKSSARITRRDAPVHLSEGI